MVNIYLTMNETLNTRRQTMKKITGGSEKQIAWAEKIRAEVIDFGEAMYDLEDEEELQELTDLLNEKLEWYANMTPFANKIENRVERKIALLRKLEAEEVKKVWEDFVENAPADKWIFHKNNDIEKILTCIFETKMFKGL
jgi:hypothetical protein